MVKLVDTPDLGSGASRRVGSSPIRRTTIVQECLQLFGAVGILLFLNACSLDSLQNNLRLK